MNWLVPFISSVAVTALLAFWVWMFWDMTNNNRIPGNEKTYWLIGFVFLNIFAAAYYYAYVYRNRP